MINGSDRVANADFERMLDNLPDAGTMCEVLAFVDPLHGIEIQQMSGGNLLEKPRFRSAVALGTPRGPTSVPFEIDATNIHEAQRNWKPAAQQAIRDFMEQMRLAQRRIIVPELAANQTQIRPN